MNQIPFFDLGGGELPLHFLHANGYPPACYKSLFDLLQKNYHLFGMHLRPLWPDARIKDVRSWHVFSDDFLRFLADRGSDSVIGVGHSIGGIVTLRAALREPHKFRAIVLLDPVLFVPRRLIEWNLIRVVGLGYRLHPKISGSLKRRRTFDDLETVFRGYRTRPVFRYMSDENLRIYIEAITRPAVNGGYELVYSPEWETHIYYTGLMDFDIWRNLPNLKVPTLIVRGAETDTFLENAEKLVRKKNSNIKLVTLEKATHILPLEHPQEVFSLMQDFLKTVN